VLLNIIIGASVFVALLTLVDFFLTERQRESLEDSAIATWDRLDEIKKFPLTEWWREGRVWQWAITLLSCAIFAYAYSLPHPSGENPIPGPPILSFAVVMATAIIIARWTIDYLLPMLSPPPVSVTFWLFPIVAGLLTAVGVIGMMRSPPAPGSAMSILGILGFFASMGLFAWAIAALPLLLVYLLAIILSCVEYLVRRVAEYKRGPVLAISVLVGGIVSLIKAFF
jgi:multidrug transporter EmrE-like cation transporter